MTYPRLEERLREVGERISRARERGGWSHPVRVIAVTKGHGAEAVQAARRAGLDDVGENRVEEALGKQEALGRLPLRWHLIGALQRRKVRQVVGAFDLIHSVDRVDLAEELARRLPPGSRQSVLVEVNTGDEPQKGGVAVDEAEALVATVLASDALAFRGLMTMAPFSADERIQRAAFGRLRRLRERLESAGTPVAEMSMGMSGDFAVAVEEGATMVRLGTILFGERDR